MIHLANKPACRVGGNMIRISIAYFYGVGAAVRPLRDIKPGKLDFNLWMTAFTAQQELGGLLNTPWFWPAIRTSFGPGQKLLDALKAVADMAIDSDVGYG